VGNKKPGLPRILGAVGRLRRINSMRRRASRRFAVGSVGLRILAAGLAMAALGLWSLHLWRSSREPPADAPLVEFAVEGLDCPLWCAVRLCDGIDDLDGACVERIDVERGTVVVRHAPERIDPAALQRRIEARGFRVKRAAAVGR
jgi:hypothetical protein